MAKAPTATQADVIRAAVALAARPSVDHLLYVGDLPLPEELFRGKPRARKRLVQAVVSENQRDVIEASGVPVLPLPDYDLGRPEKLKIALVSGIARGIYKEGDVVVGLLARKPAAYPDSILVVTVGPEDGEGSFGFLQAEGVSAGVMDTLIELAVSIGVEGWEGRPVGALFVVGDSNTVMEKSRQLTLNPFQGYSEDEKNIMNPDVRHALHAFSVLDGAFIVREDGTRGGRRPLPQLRRGEGARRSARPRRAAHGGGRDLARHRGHRDRRLADLRLGAGVPPRQGRARAGPARTQILTCHADRQLPANLPGSGPFQLRWPAVRARASLVALMVAIVLVAAGATHCPRRRRPEGA